MQFPVSIEVIDDQIVLFLGEITEEFKLAVMRIEHHNLGLYSGIRAVSAPDLIGNIYVNGDSKSCNYKIMTRPYSLRSFTDYSNTIKAYKRELGYDE